MINNNIKIKGERIYLRKVRKNDANQTYINWLNDSEVNQYLETRHEIQTIDSINQYIDKMIEKKDELFLAICLTNNEQHIGNIKLGPINSIHKFAEVSIFIGDRKEWGKGYATEAIGLLTNYAFNVLNLNKLTAGSYVNNLGSVKAFKKVGFIIEGYLKDHYLCNEKYVNKTCLAIFND